MNYRHGYHAGNIADLIKHLTLAHVLTRLGEKDTGFAVLDTHAGAGSYDLTAIESAKTLEAKSGAYAFAKLAPHPALAPLQDVIAKWNLGIAFASAFDDRQLRFYPGSPAIIAHYLRSSDRLVAVEKHPEEFKKLRKMLSPISHATLHERDGWEAITALLPLPEKRALVFIDPPFEQHDEMEKSAAALIKAHARNATYIYALWYPLTDAIAVAKMKDALAGSGIPKILCLEAEYAPTQNMRGCGMILINPPWQIETVMEEAFKLLGPLFDKHAKPAKIKWLSA